MAKKNGSIVYKCSNCGYTQPRWLGRCPECGEWNSLEEIIIDKNNVTPAGRGSQAVEKQKPVGLSSVQAQENNVHPNMILNWKKEFLENAAMIFDRHRPDITEKAQQRKIEELETKLKKKDEVIAEIAEENMMIKKTFGGRS